MTMTMEDLERIVATAVKAALAAKTGTEKTKRSLDEKHFRRVHKFSGGTGWKEFAFQFRTAMGTADEVVREILDEIIKAGKDPDWLPPFGDSRGRGRKETRSGSQRDFDVGDDR